MNASRIVEAVLFASETPLDAGDIARADESLDEDRVEEAIQRLRTEYAEEDRAFHLVELAEGYQVLTRPEFSAYLERFDSVPRPSRLSGPALEALAIVAYRQPISRVEVEYIRGVSSSGVLRTLQDRALIEVVGRGEGIGRPYLYGTTREFLDHFGFRSLEELPRTEDLPVVLRDPQPLDPDDGEDEAVEVGVPEAEDEGPSVEEAVDRVLGDEAPGDDAPVDNAPGDDAPGDPAPVADDDARDHGAPDDDAPDADAPDDAPYDDGEGGDRHG